ncbi:putative ankyrin repeats (3 copies) containing protein [Lyophyllum shimeji]|uniref:Ankyrin repeats (3 copies) containing protein n=1 Tax=Lyophyllum shimeji TaxID=47721 RepID=A0A9P3UHR4_LYOSH|nr:putative ankyrin repeats (3 copies) containing protein [Lyophyllum shimeji]
MRQTPEAEAFLKRIIALPKGPGTYLDEALRPSLDDEAELRKLFATDKTNTRLNDPFVGLVDVFDAPADIRVTRARVVKDEQDLNSKHVMPLSEANRRAEGSPSMVSDLEEFQKNWSIFTEGSLSQLSDWNNVVAAGGSVLACLTPLSDANKESKRATRKHYHSVAYPSSDIDLFLWGMNAEQAEKKIIEIYKAVRDSVPWDVTCVRTKHTVSIYSQYPYRSVQIVLRLYSSPAEVLAGFDIDAPCCLYNGERVYANPRAIVAMMRQANTVDMTRRSPSYEVRLAKYSSRGFEVYVPTLERDKVDPTIYERSISRIEGLARLLVLEKLNDAETRYSFLESRRSLRGRPNPLHRYFKRKNRYKGDLKADTSIAALEMNDYDVATLHIPYGPGWTARRIDKLIYQTDLGMNSPYNPKNKDRRLHRHPAFFGTMEECLEDCCEHCPEPIDSDERALQEEEDKSHLSGRIAFIEEDPGRQSMSGSFNPIDVGEWSAQVYIGETEHFFAAIIAQDREAIAKMIKNGLDVNRRDHVGRTALHLAIITGAADIACDLIEAGARMTARLVDGRSALHLAAQFDQPTVIRKLFERSAMNKAAAEAAGSIESEEKMDVDAPAAERPSSANDWTSEDDGVISMDTDMEDDTGDEGGVEDEGGEDEDDEDEGEDNIEDGDEDEEDGGKRRRAQKKTGDAEEEPKEAEEFPEDATDQPDVLEVNLPDWDLGFSPLAHAVMSGSLESINELLKESADATLLNTTRDTAFHPLTLTILREDEDEASKILERLVSAGASTSTADDHMRTIFHRAVVADKIKLVSTILKCDPNAATILNFPAFKWNSVTFPIVSAIERRHYSMLATLLALGAKLVFTADDVNRALDVTPLKKRQSLFPYGVANAVNEIFFPVETALAKHDDVAQLLIALGADFNIGVRRSLGEQDPTRRKSVLDWVRFGIDFLSKKIATLQESSSSSSSQEEDATATGWKKYLASLRRTAQEEAAQQDQTNAEETLQGFQVARSYLVDMEDVLLSHGAKTWEEVYPDKPSAQAKEEESQTNRNYDHGRSSPYVFLDPNYWSNNYVPQHLTSMYDELYEACFTGDNKKVEQLCLPQEESKDTTPLNIFVQVSNPKDYWARTGYTPLFAAVSARRWATARLIMAIAIAQYCPPEKEAKFSTRNVDLYEDSDDGSEDSCDSDATADQAEFTFVDIAKRPSAVETDVHPDKMLDRTTFTWYFKDKDEKLQQTEGSLLLKAIHDNDTEMFVNVASLYNSAPFPIPLEEQYLEVILEKDRPDMLDAYIRKTGRGIEVQHDHEDQEVKARNDKNRVYLGLTVHGKKRADLAKMNDPNATTHYNIYPLVWKAAADGAEGVIEYLSSHGPLAAYQHYASTGGDERAYQLRRIPDLEKVLPQWLGWTITNLGDSPLMAAILGGNLDLMKGLFAKKPKLMASCLHERIKFSGYNALLLVADTWYPSTTIGFFDYLLAKSVSPAVNDAVRGWNIYHILCQRNNCDAIEHLLKKLPRDVNEALLAQQSKGRLNTPLHLAVKEGATRTVKLILDFTTSTLLMRDIDGSTALHCAVQRGFGEITETIVQFAPPEALYMENGVGETPLDMATLSRKLELTRSFTHDNKIDASSLDPTHADENPKRIELRGLEEEIKRLQSTIEQLIQDGRLVQGTKLAHELSRFAAMMDEKVSAQMAAEENQPANDRAVGAPLMLGTQDNENPKEWCADAKRTLDAIARAVAAAPGKRLLVHLVDVQKSVQGNLARYSRERTEIDVNDDGDEFDKEEDPEAKENGRSLVLSRITVSHTY